MASMSADERKKYKQKQRKVQSDHMCTRLSSLYSSDLSKVQCITSMQWWSACVGSEGFIVAFVTPSIWPEQDSVVLQEESRKQKEEEARQGKAKQELEARDKENKDKGKKVPEKK